MSKASNSRTEQPTSRITKLDANDVILGRGIPCVRYQGNVRYREHIQQRLKEYFATNKHRTKHRLASEVVEAVQSRGGRFLRAVLACEDRSAAAVQLDEESKLISSMDCAGWKVVDKDLVMEKVKQAFRDMQATTQTKPPAVAAAPSEHQGPGAPQIGSMPGQIQGTNLQLESRSLPLLDNDFRASAEQQQFPLLPAGFSSQSLQEPHPLLALLAQRQHQNPIQSPVGLMPASFASSLGNLPNPLRETEVFLPAAARLAALEARTLDQATLPNPELSPQSIRSSALNQDALLSLLSHPSQQPHYQQTQQPIYTLGQAHFASHQSLQPEPLLSHDEQQLIRILRSSNQRAQAPSTVMPRATYPSSLLNHPSANEMMLRDLLASSANAHAPNQSLQMNTEMMRQLQDAEHLNWQRRQSMHSHLPAPFNNALQDQLLQHQRSATAAQTSSALSALLAAERQHQAEQQLLQHARQPVATFSAAAAAAVPSAQNMRASHNYYDLSSSTTTSQSSAQEEEKRQSRQTSPQERKRRRSS